MKNHRALILVAMFACLLGLSACSGGGGGDDDAVEATWDQSDWDEGDWG